MKPSTETGIVSASLAASINRRLREGDLKLPMLPQVATQAMEMCNKEDADALALSELLHRDQALATNLLRIANSPAYMPSVPIASLQQAVSRLGMRQVAELTMSVSVRANLFQVGTNRELVQELWRHTMAAGFYAKEIARARRRCVETAFLTGLLHDVGKPVLLANLQSLQADVGIQWDDETVLAVLDSFHTQAGGLLAERWKLPPQIAVAIKYHHDYSAAEEDRESAMMACLADLLAHAALPGSVAVDHKELHEHPVLEGLNMYRDQLDELLAKAETVIEMVESVTSVH